MTRRNGGRARRARRHTAKPVRRAAETVEIVSVGLQGDGSAYLEDGTRVFVPFTLPGDTVLVQPTHRRGDGLAAEVIEKVSGPVHAEPICGVFGTCGGCQLQHMPTNDYVDWKSSVVATALSRQGITAHLEPLIRVPVNSRRRATLRAVHAADGVVMGFNAPYTDRVIAITSCPLLLPRMDTLIPPLSDVLRYTMAPKSRLDIAISVIDGVVDIAFKGPMDLSLSAREAIAEFAERCDIGRIVLANPDDGCEPLIVRSDIVLKFDDIRIPVPPLSFLQPSLDGEAALQRLVCAALKDMATVADLYAGLGTFAVPLARAGTNVTAMDAAVPQIEALSLAVARSPLSGRLQAGVRDLHKAPLSVEELDTYTAVVFDPPRSGAVSQSKNLADGRVQRIVAVSCNPSTLARDLRILIDGGYRLESVTPVDQFPQTFHVEAVAVLERP